MTPLSWPRLSALAAGACALSALCAGGMWLLPMPPAELAYTPPPPPLHAALEEPAIAELESAHQVRGMKALDALLEARLLAEVPGAPLPETALREAGTQVGPDDPAAEALMVAWGDAFRAHGLRMDGQGTE